MRSFDTKWIWSLVAAGLLITVLGAGAAGDSRPVEVFFVPPGLITTDGSEQRLMFVVLDQSGRLAEEAKFNGTNVELGKLSGWENPHPGVWTVIYKAPVSSQIPQVPLSVRVKVGKGKASLETNLPMRPPAPASLDLVADSDSMIKKQDREMELRIRVTSIDDLPVDRRELQVTALLGTVDRLQGKGGGLYKARYTMPEGESTPELDYIHVIDREFPHELVDFVAVPLVGNLDWELDTGQANLAVALDVGDKRYGPTTSDEVGMAKIPILVPPGTTTAVAAVQVEGSPAVFQNVDLGLPMYNQLVMAATAEYVPGDGSTSYPIFLYITDAAGQPSDSAPVAVAASAGTVALPKGGTDGLYVAQYTPPAVDGPTEVTLTATITGHEPSSDTITFEVVPALPSAYVAQVEPSSLGPGEATATLKGQLTPPPGASGEAYGAAVYAASGALAVTPAGAGEFTATHEANFDTPRAYLAGATMLALDRPAHSLVAWAVDEQVRAGGHTTIVAMALDHHGLPVTGLELSARAKGGGARVTDGGATDERGRVVFGFDAGPLSGLSIVEVADTRGMTRFSLPIWQTAEEPARFDFPRMGCDERLWALGLWEAFTYRLAAGQGVQTDAAEGAEAPEP